jgi:putative SOS response-associated peptidase YedK
MGKDAHLVARQSVQPAVRFSRDASKREFALMGWGFVPAWAKDAKIGYNTINARAEEARLNTITRAQQRSV